MYLTNHIDTKAKCRHLKILSCKGTLRLVIICLRPHTLAPRFLFGWSSNFFGSESGQIQYRVLTPGEYGLQQDSDKHAEVPLQTNFLDDNILL
jgi:hypothetical protein